MALLYLIATSRYMHAGYLSSTWSVSLSSIQEHLHLNDGQLGIAVLCAYLFMTLAAPISALLILKYGTGLTTLLASLFYCASLPLIASSPSSTGVIFSFMFYGLSCGILDTAINSAAVLVEFAAKKEIMGSIHGMYSVAAAVGSIVAGQVSHIGWSAQGVCSAVGSFFFLFSMMFGRGLYSWEEERVIASEMEGRSDDICIRVPEEVTTRSASSYGAYSGDHVLADDDDDDDPSKADNPLVEQEDDGPLPWAASRLVPEDSSSSSRLIVFQAVCICTTGFLSVFGDSIMTTWLLIYIRRYIDGSHQVSGAGLSIFYICEALGRFFCDYLRSCYGRRRVLLVGGCLACTGLTALLLAPILKEDSSVVVKIVVCYAGTILAGFGYSMLYPTLISTAGSLPGLSTGMAVSMVTFSASCGSIIGPALVGGLSALFGSLRIAFMFNACLVSIIIPLSFGIRSEDPAIVRSSSSSGIIITGPDSGAYEKIAEVTTQISSHDSRCEGPATAAAALQTGFNCREDDVRYYSIEL